MKMALDNSYDYLKIPRVSIYGIYIYIYMAHWPSG